MRWQEKIGVMGDRRASLSHNRMGKTTRESEPHPPSHRMRLRNLTLATFPLMHPRRMRAMTLTEVLVAVAASSILVASVSYAFIQIIRSSDEAEAQVRASTGARLAVDQIARDLRQLQLDADPDYQIFRLVNQTLTYGDRYNNDGDGFTDEEQFDGFDEDGDWTSAEHDRHAETPFGPERPNYVDLPDYGDARVDEDVRFSADQVTFVVPAGSSGPGSARQIVTYRLGSFDGEDNVLLRATVTDPTSPTGPFTEVVEPVVFDVVSLDVLAWNPNDDVTSPNTGEAYWASEWDAALKVGPGLRPINAPFGVPPFKLPAAFLISVTVNAERQPLNQIAGAPAASGPLRTKTISTVVTVESTTQDIRYFLYLRDP